MIGSSVRTEGPSRGNRNASKTASDGRTLRSREPGSKANIGMSFEQHMHPGERRPYRTELLADVLRGNACAGQSIKVSARTASTLPAGLSVETVETVRGQTEATPKQILTLGHSPPSQRRF